MYYKIVNKECEVYQKLYAQRKKELEAQENNNKLLAEHIPYEWEKFNGYRNQSYGRIPMYLGFYFKNPDEVDLKTWKESKDQKGLFYPNKRYKAGRDMNDFLVKSLKRFSFHHIWEILGIKDTEGEHSVPYMEIEGEVILLYLDEKQEPEDKENVIEITKKEFLEISNVEN